MEMSYGKAAMHKVSPVLRNLEQNDKIYDPLVVSFGPYHHGKPNLQNAETHKSISVKQFVSGSGKSPEFFKNKIMEIIGDVRSCYLAGSTSRFSDSELAEMMLKDASFLLNFIEVITGSDKERIYGSYTAIVNNINRLSFYLTMRDLFLLENQIPYLVLNLMIYLRYEQSEGEEMLSKFISVTIFFDKRERKKLSRDQEQPAHLLDAFRQVLVDECICINNHQSNSRYFRFKVKDENISYHNDFHFRLSTNSTTKDENIDDYHNDFRFRSSTNLTTKGIRFKLSNSYSLRDINFKSFCFHSQLELPHMYISTYTKVFFSNMIAYEDCLEAGVVPVVTTYVSFMKMLIQNVEDVKLLRERKIVVNQLGSDEEAFQVFNDLNRFALGTDNQVFKKVTYKIQQHCNSKAQTWMAELIHTYFKSPWTFLALIAAMLLLCLGIVQTMNAVKPRWV